MIYGIMYMGSSYQMLYCFIVFIAKTVLAWKWMLDSEGFVKAGWVHDLQLDQFKASGTVKFLNGKVKKLR